MRSNKISSRFNRDHYNSVTDAWMYILGDNFHYGYFKSSDMDLKAATACLIESLAGMAEISSDSLVLDVGCGIGHPALYLHEKYACGLIGISTSKRGVDLANSASRTKNVSNMVRFQVADAIDNRFQDNYFDFLWQMESSHLIQDKIKLFDENFRVLKNHGILLLCDLILKTDLTVADLYRYRKELSALEKSFGKAKMVSLATYTQVLEDAGFSDIQTIDVSKWVLPTLEHWQKNIAQNRKKILECLSMAEVDNFILSCNILNSFFEDNILGYGFVKARKVEKTTNG